MTRNQVKKIVYIFLLVLIVTLINYYLVDVRLLKDKDKQDKKLPQCKETSSPPTIRPVHVYDNEMLLRGSELCPQSLMVINTQISPSGDVLIWCAEPPKAKIENKTNVKPSSGTGYRNKTGT